MDIRLKQVEETSRLHIRDSDDELLYDVDKPVEIVVYGPGSKRFAKAQAVQSNHMLDRLKKKGKTDQSPEDRADETAEFLAACTKEFVGIEVDKLEGDALFKAVYADPKLGFIAEQVNKHITEWGNFTKPVAKK